MIIKGKKVLLTLMVLILCITSLTSCNSNPKNFTYNNLTVTLNKSFTEETHSGFDLYAASENVIFSVVEESEEELEYSGYSIINLKAYCDEILLLNGVSSDELKQRNDYYYFINTRTISGASYTYVHCMYYGSGSYWICEFVCKTKSYDRYEKRIFKWADSVTIK
ncbi:MAG: hypothetical protein IJ763_03300 [Lachnospiraceae bacterium]|nr:hypothetical protein [Lachnospiraceae bacterium]